MSCPREHNGVRSECDEIFAKKALKATVVAAAYVVPSGCSRINVGSASIGFLMIRLDWQSLFCSCCH